MEPLNSTLSQLARRVVESMGYELVGVEYLGRGGDRAILRIYIDQEAGIDLEDCAAVSHQLSGVLDVEDPIPGRYSLEVSSPGLNRPLVYPEHFERFRGHRVKLRLAEKIEGRRNLEGTLIGLADDQIQLEVEGRTWEVPLAAVESARLVPEA
jgi:ribosome maturation factor RimP